MGVGEIGRQSRNETGIENELGKRGRERRISEIEEGEGEIARKGRGEVKRGSEKKGTDRERERGGGKVQGNGRMMEGRY